jgi:hypothetical protein
MIKDYPGEVWKTVVFDFEYSNECKFEISNYGRLKSFHKKNKDGNLLKGSLTNGYKIVRLKFFKERDPKTEVHFNYLQEQISKLYKRISPKKHSLKVKKKQDESYFATKKEVDEAMELLTSLKKSLSKKYADDLKSRTIHYHALYHRLVAEYFLVKPSEGHSIVAHLDHDKLNNKVSNLKWMTPDENYKHQQSSPKVIEEKKLRTVRKQESGSNKLTVTKVMLLKKLLNQGKPMRLLVRQFKVTNTQILRIKRGENWADVEAAK